MQHLAPDHSSEPNYPTWGARDYGQKWKAERDNCEIWQSVFSRRFQFYVSLIARTVHCGCLRARNTPGLEMP